MQYEDSSSAALTNLSTNGTFVNGEKIGKSKTRLLSTGSVISIGYFSKGTLKQYDAYKFHIKSVSKRKANDSSSGNNTSVSDLSLLEKSALAAKASHFSNQHCELKKINGLFIFAPVFTYDVNN